MEQFVEVGFDDDRGPGCVFRSKPLLPPWGSFQGLISGLMKLDIPPRWASYYPYLGQEAHLPQHGQ